MLLLVLTLVVVAFGLLVTSLATSAMLWAWVSVGVSVLAAFVLVLDWRRRRRRSAIRSAAAPPVRRPEPAPEPTVDDDPVDHQDDRYDVGHDRIDFAAEPAEEDTDAADLLVVTDLVAEVRVVDERPRYHLATCRWLADRGTLGLPVREARELGFTPCSICAPDRTLSSAHRTDIAWP